MINLKNRAYSFLKDRRGTLAMMFAATLSVVVMVVGGAVDYGRALSIRSQLQGMLDASVAAGVRKFGDTADTSAAETYTQNFFDKLVRDNNLGPGNNKAGRASPGPQLNATVDPTTFELKGIVTIDVAAPFLSVAGINNIPLRLESTAGMAGKKLELSLMLDVTGSMSSYSGGQRKMDALKDAANDLLTIFSVNLSTDATRIALVPFSESVNVGPALAPLVREYPSRTKRFRVRGSNQRWTYNLTNCVTERNGNHRFTDDPPGPGRWLNPMYSSNGSCRPSQEIVPLTSDKAALERVIDRLSPSGVTAGHLGTAWSWYLINQRWAHLFPAESQPEAKDPGKLIKATILMTDGEYNTEYCQGVNDSTINCNSPNGDSKYQAERLCEAMKADGVVVYTVGFGISRNSSQERLLQNCATDSTKYFFPYDGNALRAAFKEIGRQLAAGQAGVILRQ